MVDREYLDKLASRIKKYVRICKEASGGDCKFAGQILIIRHPNFKIVDIVYLYLLGKACTYYLGFSTKKEATTHEVTDALRTVIYNINDKTVLSRLSDLAKLGYIQRVKRGVYTIVVYKVEEFLDILEKKA